MTVQIKVRRGTKAQLDTVMSSGAPLSQGELGFTIDTNEVFVSDGTTAHLIGKVMVGLLANRPAAGVSGRLYHATDDGGTFVDDGTTWIDVSAGISSLDDVPDGSNYGKVLNSYLNTNRPDGVYDGTGKLSGTTIKTHLDDVTKHRLINDAGVDITDLWSASKITTAIDTAVAGLDIQKDILNIQTDATLDPGATPITGDRYIITNSAALHTNFGVISGLSNNDIVEFDGSGFIVAYDVSVKGEGALVWDRNSNTFQKWDGTVWDQFGGLSGITAGTGLSKIGDILNVGAGDGINVTSDTVVVNAADLAGDGIYEDGNNNLSVASDSTTGATVAPVAVSSNGVGVSIDNDSLSHVSGVIGVTKIDGGTFI